MTKGAVNIDRILVCFLVFVMCYAEFGIATSHRGQAVVHLFPTSKQHTVAETFTPCMSGPGS